MLTFYGVRDIIYSRGEEKNKMIFDFLGKILVIVETIKLIYQLIKWCKDFIRRYKGQ
nr:MAG TPA: hypothetical protein [Caudoviricetes sp.]